MTLPHACETLPNQPLVWDPTRLALKMTCDRLHLYKTIMGLHLDHPKSVHFAWGKAYHTITEQVDKHRLLGLPRASIILEAKILAETLSWDDELKQPRWGENFTLYRCTSPATRPMKRDPSKQTINELQCSWAKKWFEELPMQGAFCARCHWPIEKSQRWFNGHKKKTRANLIAAAVAYAKADTLPPYAFMDGSSATEVGHSVDLPILSPDGTPYKLRVNIDSIVEYDGWAAIRERKTTGLPKLDGRFWTQYQMNPQVDSYDLVGRVIYSVDDRPPDFLIEATRVTEKGKVEIAREVIPIPEERSEEWFGELQGVIKAAEARALAMQQGTEPEAAFPRNTTACHSRFGTCAFWRLCTEAPSKRADIIAKDYRVEHWDPVAAESIIEETEE